MPRAFLTEAVSAAKVFPVAELIRVVPGMQEPSSVQSDSSCLTLHLTSRTIQLECDNEKHRDAWVEAFQWLVSETLKKKRTR